MTLDFHRIHLTALRDQDAATRILAVRGLWEEEKLEYMHLLIGQVLAKVALSIVLVPFLITGGVAFARWLDRR